VRVSTHIDYRAVVSISYVSNHVFRRVDLDGV